MTDCDYFASGSTALFDTIGHTINHIKKIHSYLRKKDIPQKVTFVIITDGMENSSRNYNKSEIKELIEFNKNQNGWEFIFIGANMDAMETASHIGINKNRSANYIADKKEPNLCMILYQMHFMI